MAERLLPAMEKASWMWLTIFMVLRSDTTSPKSDLDSCGTSWISFWLVSISLISERIWSFWGFVLPGSKYPGISSDLDTLPSRMSGEFQARALLEIARAH